MRRPTRSPLFPYTALFRSVRRGNARAVFIRECHLSLVPFLGLGRLTLGWIGALHAVAGVERARSAVARRRRLPARSEEHTSELQSRQYLVCRLLLEKKNPP